VRTAYQKIPFYRERFDKAEVKPEDICALEDIPRLPLTEYMDFTVTPIEQKLAVPWTLVADIMTTSGTISGSAQPVVNTAIDEEDNFALLTRTAKMAGISSDDTVHFYLPGTSLYRRLKSWDVK